MKNRIIFLFILGILLQLIMVSCSKETTIPKEEVTNKPVEPSEPIDPKTLYNSIKLPDQWPPKRSYSSDIRNGMSPLYLSNKPECIDISIGRQLFVDNFLIESTSLKRKFYYPEYHSSNPILKPDKEWEKMGNNGAAFAAPFSDGVWYDETARKFKMWYMAGGGQYSTNSSGVTCYAESDDGIIWVKPALSLVSGTNIVDKGSERDASTIWLDKQETNSTKRYKMFVVAGGKGNWKYHYKTSSDGKLWRDNLTPSKAVADRSTVYKNSFRNVWVWSMRHNIRVKSTDPYTVRARDYYENSDPVIGNQEAKADLANFWFGTWPNEQKHSFYNNNDGSPGIYNFDAIPYESIMLGLFSVWQGPENDVCSSEHVVKRNQIMVGYSRDGYNWFREDMNPFLSVNNDKTSWNNGNIQSVVGTPIIVDDKLYFYVSGRRLVGDNEIATTGLATLRRDGFASMSGTGEITTSTLTFSGSYFFVNANLENGDMKVEIINEDGSIIPGFSKNDCKSIAGNSVKKRVEWSNSSTLESLKNKKVRFKFYITNGEIFSFWVSPNETGESQGYTAGGGPNLNSSGIDKK